MVIADAGLIPLQLDFDAVAEIAVEISDMELPAPNLAIGKHPRQQGRQMGQQPRANGVPGDRRIDPPGVRWLGRLIEIEHLRTPG